MATLTKETPAQTMLRIERQNIERTGEATPSVPTGPISRTANASTLPTGFGADLTGKIFRYNGDGSLNTGTSKPTTTPSSTPSVTPTPPAGAGSGVSGLDIKGVLSRSDYEKQFAPEVIDEASIRERIRAEQQQRIDAINSVYDDMVRRQMNVNEGNMGSTRAINARSGLLGSDFGNANISNQRAVGQQAIDAVNRERGLRISQVFADIDASVADKIEAEKAAAAGKANEYKSYVEKTTTEARERAKALGQQGLSYDQLKAEAPDKLKQLLESTGYDEFTLAATMNAAKPPAEQTKYEIKTIGNRVIAYGVNPTTGQLETLEKELPAEAIGNKVEIINGELWSITPDGKSASVIGKSTPKPLTKTVKNVIYTSTDNGITWQRASGSPAPAAARSSGGGVPKKNEKTVMTEIQKGIASANLAGPDGFIAPDTYQGLRAAWVSDGFNPTTFDTQMKGYRNPSNPNYVTVKQSE